jgi:hypothetical protein
LLLGARSRLCGGKGRLRGRADSVERRKAVLSQLGIEFTGLRRLSDEALVGALHVLGLNFDCLVERLDTDELLEGGSGVLERLLGVVSGFNHDRLSAGGGNLKSLHGCAKAVLAEFLDGLKRLVHGGSPKRVLCPV